MTLAIGHREKELTVVDVVREISAPFVPENAVEEFAAVLKSYRISGVTGDRYGGEWPRQAFQKRGILYACNEAPKSGLYVDFLPKLNSNRNIHRVNVANSVAKTTKAPSRYNHDFDLSD
jgi:hypothetical protein